jgi:hypothetical protein
MNSYRYLVVDTKKLIFAVARKPVNMVLLALVLTWGVLKERKNRE